MPSFSGGNGAFTPSITTPGPGNWTLDAGAATAFARITEFSWGGRLSTSTGYRTRWTRATTNATGTQTALTVAGNNPNFTTPGAALVASYGTTNPTLAADPAGNLHAQDWNAQGGVGYIVLPLAQPWWVIGTGGASKQQIQCINVAGVDPSGSSYNVVWQED